MNEQHTITQEQVQANIAFGQALQNAVETHADAMESSYVEAAINGTEESHPLNTPDIQALRTELTPNQQAAKDADTEIADIQTRLDSGLLRTSEVTKAQKEISDWKEVKQHFVGKAQENSDDFRDLVNAEAQHQNVEALDAYDYWTAKPSEKAAEVEVPSETPPEAPEAEAPITLEDELNRAREEAAALYEAGDMDAYTEAVNRVNSIKERLGTSGPEAPEVTTSTDLVPFISGELVLDPPEEKLSRYGRVKEAWLRSLVKAGTAIKSGAEKGKEFISRHKVASVVGAIVVAGAVSIVLYQTQKHGGGNHAPTGNIPDWKKPENKEQADKFFNWVNTNSAELKSKQPGITKAQIDSRLMDGWNNWFAHLNETAS
jgi:hypothetical protein